MGGTRTSADSLMKSLAAGWTATQYSSAQGFVASWQASLSTTAKIEQVAENSLRFVTDLSSFHLRGLDSVPCLLVGGSDANTATAARTFYAQTGAPGGVPFILALSDAFYQQLRQDLPSAFCLVLSPGQIKELLESGSARQMLRAFLMEQIPKRHLIPYTILQPVEGAMFFGRRNELARLRDQPGVSFAIAGPSRLGKSSLLRQYRREAIRSADPRVARMFYISFYDCSERTMYGMARFLAMRIAPSRLSNRLAEEDLVSFLHYQSSRLGGPLELLLDEVDEVCQSEAFRSLGTAARRGFCRLVLCGRGVLLRMILASQSPLNCRLELVRLEPLDPDSARGLLVEPLVELGFAIREPECFIEQVFRLTGRLPHLLQFYGNRLANLAIDQNSDTISLKQVETLAADFQTAQYFTNPLSDLGSADARLVALSLLEFHDRDLSVPFVQGIAEGEGLRLDHARTLDICNELVINNVLVWSDNSYRIASEALYSYARDLGFLASGLREARKAAGVKP